jgi:hypothetical protein
VPGLFSRVKRLRNGVDRPLPSSAEVEEIGELHLYIPSWSSWPVPG